MNRFKLGIMAIFLASSPILMAKGGGHKWKKMKSELNLTAEQETKIKGIHQAAKENRKASKEKMKQAKKTFEELLKSNASEPEIQAAFMKLQELKNEKAKTRFTSMMAIRQVLTPEQRANFRPFKGHGHKRHHGGHGKWHD